MSVKSSIILIMPKSMVTGLEMGKTNLSRLGVLGSHLFFYNRLSRVTLFRSPGSNTKSMLICENTSPVSPRHAWACTSLDEVDVSQIVRFCNRTLRNSSTDLRIPLCKPEMGSGAFRGVTVWNQLSHEVKTVPSLAGFKTKFKMLLKDQRG